MLKALSRLWRKRNPVQEFADKFTSLPVAITSYSSTEPVILAANKRHEELTGYKKERCLYNTPRMFQGPLTDPDTRKSIKHALINDDYYNGIVVNHKPSGEIYKIRLTIVGVIINGEKYYMATKEIV